MRFQDTRMYIPCLHTETLKFKDKEKARASKARQADHLKEEKELSQILYNT